MITTDATITIGAIALSITLGINIYNFINNLIVKSGAKGEEKGMILTKLEEISKKLDSLTNSNDVVSKAAHDLTHIVTDHERRLSALEKKRVVKKIDSNE